MGTKKGVIILRIAALLLLISCFITVFLALDDGRSYLLVASVLALSAGVVGIIEVNKPKWPKISFAIIMVLLLYLLLMVAAGIFNGEEYTVHWGILALILGLPYAVTALLRKHALSRVNQVAPSKCEKCGTEIPDGVKFCGNCGSNVEYKHKICKHCGTELSLEFKFCEKCGQAL